ncbi:hypothetical protein ACUIAC_00940 [Dermabacteraceae bacterium P13138]
MSEFSAAQCIEMAEWCAKEAKGWVERAKFWKEQAAEREGAGSE